MDEIFIKMILETKSIITSQLPVLVKVKLNHNFVTFQPIYNPTLVGKRMMSVTRGVDFDH